MKKIARFIITAAGCIFPIEVACMVFTAFVLGFLGWIFGFQLPDPYYSMLKDIFGLEFWPNVRLMFASAILWLIPPTRRVIGRGIADIGTALVLFGITLTGDTFYKVPLAPHHAPDESR